MTHILLQMKITRYLVFSLSAALLLTGCSQESNHRHQTSQHTIDAQLEQKYIEFDSSLFDAREMVFYNLFSPVDLSHLITKKQAYYNSTLINPLNNITKYNETARIAAALGVYGADLSYLWMYDQTQQSLSYLSAVQRLSDQLEIPREFVDFSYTMAESHSQQLDTLINIASNTYKEAEVYLKNNHRGQYADLILLGGWIETMYIATQMYTKPDARFTAKIAAQKFSLNSLYRLMQRHNSDITFTEYILYLKKLVKIYDSANLVFPPDSMVVDTANKRIMVKNEAIITISPETIEEIRLAIGQIRHKMVN